MTHARTPTAHPAEPTEGGGEPVPALEVAGAPADAASGPSRRTRRIGGWAAVLFVGLTAVAVAVNAPAHQRRLADRAERRLAEVGLSNLHVEPTASALRITGARSEAEAVQAQALVSTLSGVGRVEAVSPADAAGVAHSEPGAAELTVTLSSAHLTLRGQVPSRAVKVALLDTVGTSVGERAITDEVRVAGAPADATVQADVAVFAVVAAALPRDLLAGTVSLHERTLSVSGRARSAQNVQALRDLLARVEPASPGLRVDDRIQPAA